MQLLNRLSPSNQATISDKTSLNTSLTNLKNYKVVIDQLLPSVNNVQLYLWVYVNGILKTDANYQTGGTYYANYFSYSGSNVMYIIPLSSISNDITLGGASSEIDFINPSQTSSYKTILSNSTWNINNSLWGAGQYQGSTGAITGFQLGFSSGNIVSGNIDVYGY